MDKTSSVSKGVFVFKNGFKTKTRKKKTAQKTHNIYESQLWYQSYKDLWEGIEKNIQKLNSEMFSKILRDLLEFIQNCYINSITEIPTATLLMGINMPDHVTQFSALSSEIKENVTPHVATLYAQDCSNIKSLIENMVSQFVNETLENDDSDEETDNKKIRKSLCTFSFLQAWYKNKYPYTNSPAKENDGKQEYTNSQRSLVIIIPEFESFNEIVLQHFILIASSYIIDLPFLIIFGVATSVAVIHKSLPYQVSSKLNMQVFSTQSATEYLNNILNNILLTDKCYFHLGGITFSLFTDIFIFYDLSVKGFIQNFKYVMLEHYCNGNEIALCTSIKRLDNVLKQFDHDDLENVRKLMSFRKFVEDIDFETRIKLLEDDTFFKNNLKNNILKFHEYIATFHVFLKCLLILVSDLPNAPLGKQYRELYATAMSENIFVNKEYNKCIQLLGFLSKDELLSKIRRMCDTLEGSRATDAIIKFCEVLSSIHKDINMITNETIQSDPMLTEKMNRIKLKEEILKLSKKGKQQNNYEKLRDSALAKMTLYFKKHLVAPTEKPFHEIFIFNNIRGIKNHIVGEYRGAIHVALNNPQKYLRCQCCTLPSEGSILRTFPDLCIVYKLHLECGKLINMYDLLQAFLAIVQPSDADMNEKTVDPKIQARFTRAIAELEFLGFVKSSRRKLDHIQRLTWGGC